MRYRMANFLGEFECKLDSKLRIALPAALRKQLPVEAEGRLVVNRGFEQHLVLYPFTEWRRVTAECRTTHDLLIKSQMD